MTVTPINPDSLAPATGFSHAVRATGTTVFLAGQTALDADGSIIDGDIAEQFEQALTNLLTALREAGGTPADLTSMTVYLVDIDGYRARARDIGRVWKRLIGRTYPAMAAVGVARLWDIEALVEVQAVAVLPSAG